MPQPRLAFFLLILSVCSGCATIMNGSTVPVTISTAPNDARAKVNGQVYSTPATVAIPRGQGDFSIHIEKDGYESQDVPLKEKIGGWVWGNVILGGLIGLGVDLITKRAYTLEEHDISIELKQATNNGSAVLTSTPLSKPLSNNDPSRLQASDVDAVPLNNKIKPNAYAVVFGIEEYRQKLPRADFAAHDARIVGDYLTKALGYPEENVVIRINEKASLTDMGKYLDQWLPNHVEKDATVFIYYSGHGAPNPKTGEAYFIPYDGDPTFLETTAYPMKRLYATLEKIPAKEVIVVLDSCFSGAGGRSVMAKGAKPIVVQVDNPVLVTTKAVMLTASSGDQVSSAYEEKNHGLLTYYFLKGLQGEADINHDGAVDIAEVFEYLKPKVEKIARREFNNEQSPQLYASPEILQTGIQLIEIPKPQ